MHAHHLSLATKPFNAIASGNKTIESRLFDAKRQAIKLSDTIVFTNRENPSQAISVTVIGLLRYRTFEELFVHNNPAKFGGESVSWLLNQINEFFSAEEQVDYGVLGIEFRIL